MKWDLHIRFLLMILIPPLMFIISTSVAKALVPQVTTDTIIQWASNFKKTKETMLTTKKLFEELPIRKDLFKLYQKTLKISEKKSSHKAIKQKPKQQWNLSMTILGPRKRLALINGVLVTEGTMINGYIVREIGKDHVILMRGREIKRIKLSKGG